MLSEAPHTLDQWYKCLRLLGEDSLTSQDYCLLEQGTLNLNDVASEQFEEKFAQSLERRLRTIMRASGKGLESAARQGDIDMASRSIRIASCAFSQFTFVKQTSALSGDAAMSFANQIMGRIDEFWGALISRLERGQIYGSAWFLSDLLLLVKRADRQVRQRMNDVEFCIN